MTINKVLFDFTAGQINNLMKPIGNAVEKGYLKELILTVFGVRFVCFISLVLGRL
jgi:hypothetical protein